MYAANQQQKWKEPDDDAVDLVTVKKARKVKAMCFCVGCFEFV